MRRNALLAIVLLGLALRVAYTYSDYGASLNLDYPGDYWDYHIAAKQILAGDTSFTHRIFLVRPPIYPLVVAALNVNRPLLILLNQLLAIMIIPLTYTLARQLRLPVRLALLAALIVALDPTSVKYSGILLAEPLANLLLAAAFAALLALKRAETRSATVTWGLLAGGLIALSALTRPAAYLLWLPLCAWIVGARWRKGLRGMAALALALATFAGAYQSLIEVWGPLSALGPPWNVALLLGSALGIWSLFQWRRWIDALFLLLPCAYFVAGTLLVCTTCMDTRARVMITPLLAVMAVFGVLCLLNRRRAASASSAPRAGH